jgi:hypothetical protein
VVSKFNWNGNGVTADDEFLNTRGIGESFADQNMPAVVRSPKGQDVFVPSASSLENISDEDLANIAQQLGIETKAADIAAEYLPKEFAKGITTAVGDTLKGVAIGQTAFATPAMQSYADMSRRNLDNFYALEKGVQPPHAMTQESVMFGLALRGGDTKKANEIYQREVKKLVGTERAIAAPDTPTQDRTLYKAGDKVQDIAEQYLPTSERDKGRLSSQVAGGVGQLGGNIAATVVADGHVSASIAGINMPTQSGCSASPNGIKRSYLPAI